MDTQISLVNGETWSRAEVSKHKDVHGRVTLRPLAGRGVLEGLSASVSGSLGAYEEGANQDRHRVLALTAFEHEHAVLGVEYLRAWDRLAVASGVSGFGYIDAGIFGVAEGLRLVARAERLNPSESPQANPHNREIVGVGYRVNQYLHVLVDGEFLQYDDSVGQSQKLFFVHTEAGF